MVAVSADFGAEKLSIDVPDDSTIVEFSDPPFLDNPRQKVIAALNNPVASPPLSELVKPGMRVAIGFDDPTRPPLPWQTILPLVIDELTRAGVKDRDIALICANGAHRKWLPDELRRYLGAALYDRFSPTGRGDQP